MLHPMTEKKEQLKQMANHIRTLKDGRKSGKTSNYECYKAGRSCRIEHIAYCLTRGRTYEQIEQPKECNRIFEYEWKKINTLHETLKAKVDEATAEYLKNKYEREVSNG
jgi:hypothetical protein